MIKKMSRIANRKEIICNKKSEYKGRKWIVYPWPKVKAQIVKPNSTE
jgi:hypothetical protein